MSTASDRPDEGVKAPERRGILFMRTVVAAAVVLAAPILPLRPAFGSQETGAIQDLRIRSTDGFELAARLHSTRGPGPGVLLLHQCNRQGDETGLEGLAAALAAGGFHVVELDTRGFGASRNEQFREYRSQDELIDTLVGDDVEASLRFLESRPGVARHGIGIVGASCGTWQAISAAHANERVRALMFLSGSYLGLASVEAEYRAITDRPVLAVFSEDDRYGTPDSMRAAFAASRNPNSRLIVYKGDAHGAPLLRQDPSLEEAVVRWFEEQMMVPNR